MPGDLNWLTAVLGEAAITTAPTVPATYPLVKQLYLATISKGEM